MSGGFFRGTSADQDTRFSNKQAKLLKSQKFAPELEYLVDVRKVKMDVIRPWIANRVTELLGFEDEVLINFIYGLLDAKEVNGKEVQISLTGFMEKNTGKFMKELWSLLLSAQKNESGVPQQFLDAKAEETQKKQAEVDRITHEIQKKKEKESRELEQERSRKMDGEAKSPAVEPTSRHVLPKDSTIYPADGEETERNRMRGRTRRSSSQSRSPSNSRSYSGDRQGSRSVSISPEGRHSPRKRSIASHHRHSPQVSFSPPRRISSYSRRRSRSLSHHGSPSPVRRRTHSQFWRRSPSPMRHRSRSPIRRRRSPSPPRIRRSPSLGRRFRSRSPVRRYRSPSPVRRRSRSPIRHRSPSPRRRSPHPFRRRSPPLSRRRHHRSPSTHLRSYSPIRHRSPITTRRRSPPSSHRRSPSQSSPSAVHHRSPLPAHRRLPALSGHQSLSPYRSSSSSPVQHRSPIPARRRSSSPSLYRSPSPYGSSSSSPVQNRSVSPVRRMSHTEQRSPLQSPRVRARTQDKMSALQQMRGSLRSPVRFSKDRKDFNSKMPDSSPSPYRSPIHSESPPNARDRSRSEERRRLHGPYESPVHWRGGRNICDDSLSPPQKPREQKPRHEVTDAAWDDGREARSSKKRSIYSSTVTKRKLSPMKVHHKDEQPSQGVGSQRATEFWGNTDRMEPRKIDQEMKSEKSSVRGAHPENSDVQKSLMYKEEVHKPDETLLHLNSAKDIDRRSKSESTPILVNKVDHSNGGGRFNSGSESSDKHRAEKRKRKHKRLHRQELPSDDDDSHESEIEGRKEAKKRRKEEKRQRKEEKRRRREERRRRKEERRAEKMKLKPRDASSSSDEHDGKRVSHPSDDDDTQSEQKKLEIELRKKALESLKAKKGISH